MQPENTGIKVAIIAKADKEIEMAYNHGHTTMGKCFKEIGFEVSFIPSIHQFSKTPSHRLPHLLAVDISSDEEIIDRVEELLSCQATQHRMTVILYNFPAPELIHTRRFFRNTYYLGFTFTDRDIFMIATKIKSNFGDTDTETPALEGEIFDESLIEVFQFLEIGKKTGCLLIQNKGPFGIAYIGDGIITYAATGNSTGKDALLEMLALGEGHFKFAGNKKYPSKNCNYSIASILMEWSKFIDETKNLETFIAKDGSSSKRKSPIKKKLLRLPSLFSSI